MPELIEQMYCSQQIVIPPKFPYILKRYCKAAIKTQPYDLLRWSFEYFRALSQRRPPPVKLRLEYPVYSTEGGLTRGCLKVLANQLSSMIEVPLPSVKAAWQGFCLDQNELRRILCLCEVYQREDSVPFLHFIAVAGGLLTKSLTHTMILLCESLTKEPDGGSAAIPVADFLQMYRFLARIDASKDVKYLNGYREGWEPEIEEEQIEEEESVSAPTQGQISVDEYWEEDKTELHKISLVDDSIPIAPKISIKLQKPIIGCVSRSPSVERAAEIERENYLKDRKGKPPPDEETEAKLKEMSALLMGQDQIEDKKVEVQEQFIDDGTVRIIVYDEEDTVVPYELYGEPRPIKGETTISITQDEVEGEGGEEEEIEEKPKLTDEEVIKEYVKTSYQDREFRRKDLQTTFTEITALVNKFKNAQYDLGMVAGRQMSTTSGEFIVQNIEKEILDYIDEQIAILPDPNLKKKKAKPEEVAMIRELLESFVDDNMDLIAPESELVEEEEEPIPEITVVYAVPGIGPPVEEDIIREFEEYALEICKVQAEVFMPRNIRHFLCPPLEKYVEHIYEDEIIEPKQREEVPTGGALTD